MRKFLILGTQLFNNYMLIERYLNEMIPAGSILLTCGTEEPLDILVEQYGIHHGYAVEKYPLASKTRDYYDRRNRQVVDYSDHVIIFSYGKIPKPVMDICQIASRYHRKLTYIDLVDEDLVSFNMHVDLIPELEMFSNGFTIERSADCVDMILRSDKICDWVYSLKKEDMHPSADMECGGIISWMALNKNSVMNYRETHHLVSVKSDKNPHVSEQSLYDTWSKKDKEGYYTTVSNLPILKGFTRVVIHEHHVYLEAYDTQVVTSSVYLSQRSREDDGETQNTLYYNFKDNKHKSIMYKQKAFGEPFRTGCWYIDVTYLQDS